MIAIEDFGDFFEAVHGAGMRPFAWQEDLLRRLADTGTWPEQIIAPTGAGKSSVVEIHIFAAALFAVGAAERPPRRLAVVVNRRALTDSHAARAARIQRLLEEAPADDSILSRVRGALVGLRAPDAEDRTPFGHHHDARGGRYRSSLAQRPGGLRGAVHDAGDVGVEPAVPLLWSLPARASQAGGDAGTRFRCGGR